MNSILDSINCLYNITKRIEVELSKTYDIDITQTQTIDNHIRLLKVF